MSNFLRHEKCPKCGSEDNVSVFLNDDNNETKYCHTPGCNYMVTDVDVGSVVVDTLSLPHYQESRPIRGITRETLRLYNVGVSSDDGSLVFPYYREGRLVAYKQLLKKRKPNGKKDMFFSGNPNKELFGNQTTNTKRHALIITEGELDAMSAYQMTGMCSVSIPTGADGALKAVKQNIKYIEQFKRVYICFDNDDAGRHAADEVMDFLKAGVAFRVLLQEYKDANDYLVNSASTLFKTRVSNATQKPIETLYSRDELKEVFNDLINGRGEAASGIPTGFAELDQVFTLREEEVTTIFADPAVGKSSFCRQIMSNLIRKKIPVLLVAYEESDSTYIEKTLNMFYGCEMNKERYQQYSEDIFNNFYPYLQVAKVSGGSIQDIEECIENAVRCYDVKVVVFDNVTACTAGEADMHNKIGQYYMMFNKLGKQYKHHTLVVSHTKRDVNLKSEKGEIPFMRQGYGSGGIERYSYNVIALGRAHDSDVTGVAIRKNRTTGDLTEFEITWNSKTKSFNEVSSDVRPKLIPYTQGQPSGQELRLSTGEASPSGSTEEHTEDSIEEPTRDIRSEHPEKLQSRLSDTVSEGEHLRGSKGEVRLSVTGDNAESNTRRKVITCIGGKRLFKVLSRSIEEDDDS